MRGAGPMDDAGFQAFEPFTSVCLQALCLKRLTRRRSGYSLCAAAQCQEGARCASVHVDLHADGQFNDLRCFPGHVWFLVILNVKLLFAEPATS